ncbi:hypothetical protein CEXT_447641 [Caerostris extrusa]|uniref:Uncharacterized protein n=1 Tax=Caerostris extrusa TaxID=172846 RepID=A0AAV4VMA7_CAEEX|nr:hypothetical protein CEXT_447641 [Caerostris extrusa]
MIFAPGEQFLLYHTVCAFIHQLSYNSFHKGGKHIDCFDINVKVVLYDARNQLSLICGVYISVACGASMKSVGVVTWSLQMRTIIKKSMCTMYTEYKYTEVLPPSVQELLKNPQVENNTQLLVVGIFFHLPADVWCYLL